MKSLFILIAMFVGGCEALAQVDFTPTSDGVISRTKGGSSLIINGAVYSQLDMATDPTFTAGIIYVAKIGRVITLTGAGATHTSASTPDTDIGFLPENIRPVVDFFNVHVSGSSGTNRIQIKDDGRIAFSYVTPGGGALSQTSTNSWSVTYLTK